MLKFHLLGTPRILKDGVPIQISRRQSRTLLYYLAGNEGYLSRTQLIQVFWADQPDKSARQALRTGLYHLKKAIQDALVTSGEMVGLSKETWIDVRTLVSLLDAPQLSVTGLTETSRTEIEQALQAYQGEFLSGVSLPDSDAYEKWLVMEREHMRRLVVRGHVLLAEHAERKHDFMHALAYLEQAMRISPLQEDVYRHALRLHYLAGERSEAIRKYDLLRKRLDEAMGVPPMPETRKLYDDILNERLPREGSTLTRTPIQPAPKPRQVRSPKPHTQLPFVGRQKEIQQLRHLTANPQLVIIEGEAGIGKTRLVQEFIQETKFQALQGKAQELERSIPYQPVVEALRSFIKPDNWTELQNRLQLSEIWWAEIARLLPEIHAVAHVPQNISDTNISTLPNPAMDARLWESVRQLLLRTAHLGPTVFVLDDLHWADASTMAMLNYLVRQTEPHTQLTFLVTTRPHESNSELGILKRALHRENRLATIQLSRLAEPELETLATSLSPQHADALTHWLFEMSEGNPFVLAEILRNARERGLYSQKTGLQFEELQHTFVVPEGIHNLIEARLSALSPDAKKALHIAVVIGRDFTFEQVKWASELTELATLEALDALEKAGLVYPTEGLAYRFDHLLIMEVAWKMVSQTRHRLLHRRVAETLEELYQDQLENYAGVLAFHYAEGYDLTRAAPYAFRAGKRALQLSAWREAIAFFEQALKVPTAIEEDRVWFMLGEARLFAGEADEAVTAFHQAYTLAKAAQASKRAYQACDTMAQAMLLLGRYDDAIAAAKELLEAPEYQRRAQFLWGTALSVQGLNLQEAFSHLQSAEAYAAQIGDHLAQAHALFEMGSVVAQQGKIAKAVDLYRQASTLLEPSAEGQTIFLNALILNNLAYHLHLLESPEALSFVEKGLTFAQEKGALGILPYLYSTRGEIAMAEGALAQAEAFFEKGLSYAQQLNNPERITGLTANLGLLAQQQGKTQQAITRLQQALHLADEVGTRHLAAQIRIWLAPLLPASQTILLDEARNIAQGSGRQRLLEEIQALESH